MSDRNTPFQGEEAEDLLRALADLEREQREGVGGDERLDALAAGSISDAELRELQALAAEDDEWSQAMEVFEPLDDAALDRMTAQVLAEMGAGAAEIEEVPAEEAPAAPDNVVALPTRRRRAWMWGAGLGTLAAAAALVLMLGKTQHPPMPGYTLEVAQGAQTMRGDEPEGEITRLTPDTRLDMVIRPAKAVKEKLEVRGFLSADGEITPWRPPVELTPKGVAQIVGRAGDVLPPNLTGRVTLILAIGVPDALPQGPKEIEAALQSRPSEGWRLLTHEVELVKSLR